MLLPKNVQTDVSEKSPALVVKSNFYNNISSCVIPELNPSSSHFKVRINLKGQNHNTFIAAMVDCGATALFISKKFIKKHKVRTHLLFREIPLYNIDGTKNHAEGITQFAHL